MRLLPQITAAILMSLTMLAAPSPSWAVDPGLAPTVTLDIHPQPIGDALNEFAQRSGLQIVFYSQVSEGVMAPRVAGTFTSKEALGKLLAGTSLSYEFINERTVAIVQPGDLSTKGAARSAEGLERVGREMRVTQAGEPSSAQGAGQGENFEQPAMEKTREEQDPEREGIPEILVTGSTIKSLNLDIRRTADDTQPYVVFERDVIDRSAAVNLEEFFKNNLPMSVSSSAPAQTGNEFGNVSKVNLRGLGSDETLILVDGRRVAGLSAGMFGGGQADINTIPLSAIERIEVLPTTASGIYGGGATGGVINIVLRRDYSGLQTRFTYGNTFESDAATRRVDMSAGFSLNTSKPTNLLFAASYSDANPLLVREREFARRGRLHILANNPEFYYSASTPPLGYTSNICSATVLFPGTGFCNAAPLTLDDGTSLDSSVTSVPSGYESIAADGGNAFVANAGTYNLDLANTTQPIGGARESLLNNPRVYSATVTARRDLAAGVHGFIELGASENNGSFAVNPFNIAATLDADAPGNPFGQDILITAPAVGADARIDSMYKSQRAVGGLIFELPREWQGEIDFIWNRTHFSYDSFEANAAALQGAVDNGSIDLLRDLNLFQANLVTYLRPAGLSPARTLLKDAALRIAGPLPWSLPAGDIVVSTLIEYRDESFDEFVLSSQGRQRLIPDRDQSVSSAYLEARIPLVTSKNSITAVDMLELQLAVRGDRYKVRGATGSVALADPLPPIVRFTNDNASIDPTVGVRYQPRSGITLRTSYGTGYRPPSVTQLVPAPGFTFVPPFTDPRRGNEPLGSVTFAGGGDPNLQPEESESWSAGLILTPPQVTGLRFAVDWMRIIKRDNIAPRARGVQSDLDNEEFLPGLVARAPVPEGEDPSLYGVGPITAISTALTNISRLQVEAVDLSVNYRLDTSRFGAFDLSIGATRMLTLETQLSSVAPTVENLGVASAFANDEGGTGGGLKWKASSSLLWQYRNWTLGWSARFFDSYFLNTEHAVVPNQGGASVPSQAYHDIIGSYAFDEALISSSNLLSNVEIRFGVTNVFNKTPPIDVDSNFGRLYYSSWGDPRLAHYFVSIQKGFGDSR